MKVEQDAVSSAFLMTSDVYLTGELYDEEERQGALVLFRGEDEALGTKFIVYLEFTSHQGIVQELLRWTTTLGDFHIEF